ncbi:hypothetical protein D9M68_880470 [compost metagenome]
MPNPTNNNPNFRLKKGCGVVLRTPGSIPRSIIAIFSLLLKYLIPNIIAKVQMKNVIGTNIPSMILFF